MLHFIFRDAYVVDVLGKVGLHFLQILSVWQNKPDTIIINHQLLFCHPRVEVTSCFVYKVMGLTFHDRLNTQLIYRIAVAQVVTRRITKPQRTFFRFESHWLLFFIHFFFNFFFWGGGEGGGDGGLILLFSSCLLFFSFYLFFIIIFLYFVP